MKLSSWIILGTFVLLVVTHLSLRAFGYQADYLIVLGNMFVGLIGLLFLIGLFIVFPLYQLLKKNERRQRLLAGLLLVFGLLGVVATLSFSYSCFIQGKATWIHSFYRSVAEGHRLECISFTNPFDRQD